MIISQKHQEVYANIIEMNQLIIENSESLKFKIRITGKPIADGNINTKKC